MVHSPKRISHITNIKFEPYSVVTDTSTVATDYASVASNESFCDTSNILDDRLVFGPWPKPPLPMKSHSESNHNHKLLQCIEHDDMKKSSSMDIAIHCEKPTEEVSTMAINVPIAGNAREKLSENNLHAKTAVISHEQDATESEHSIQMITPLLSLNEQNKLRFEQLQQRLTSPLVSTLGARIETTGESSTDQDLAINETDNIKMPIVTLQSVSQSIKSKGIHDKIDDELAAHNPSYFQQKHIIDLQPTASIPSGDVKTQKLLDATYETALSEEDIHLKSDPFEQHGSNNNNNNNNSNDVNMIKEKYINGLMLGIGKILRKKNGGIAALYKNALEKPDSRFSKILYSMIA